MQYHIAKKHSKATARTVHKLKICDKHLQSFYNLQEHERRDHGAERGSRAQNADVARVMGDVDDNSWKEEHETCKHFSVDSEMENGRHRVYNFAMDTLGPKYLLKKVNAVTGTLKCAAKLNIAFGFVLKNVEDGSCRW